MENFKVFKFSFCVVFLYLISCSPCFLSSNGKICNKERAIDLAKKCFTSKGYSDQYYDLKVMEDSTTYTVIFKLDQSKANDGGGGEIRILKQNCDIIDQKFYQ